MSVTVRFNPTAFMYRTDPIQNYKIIGLMTKTAWDVQHDTYEEPIKGLCGSYFLYHHELQHPRYIWNGVLITGIRVR